VSKLQITTTYESSPPKQTINFCKDAQDNTKMRTKMLDHYFWTNLKEGVGAERWQYAYLAMEVSESYGRCMIHKYVRTERVTCTTAVLDAHLPRTTRTPHAQSKAFNFRKVGEWRASGLHEPLAP
jgi:hypothetical protein